MAMARMSTKLIVLAVGGLLVMALGAVIGGTVSSVAGAPTPGDGATRVFRLCVDKSDLSLRAWKANNHCGDGEYLRRVPRGLLINADTLDGIQGSELTSAIGDLEAFEDRFGSGNGAASESVESAPGSGGAENLTIGECTIAEVSLFAGNFAPRETAFTHGQLLPISTNTALFSILGTMYGGDGETTFGLPDLRGLEPEGVNYVICLQGIFPSRP